MADQDLNLIVHQRLGALMDRYPDPEDAEIAEGMCLRAGLEHDGDEDAALRAILARIEQYEQAWEDEDSA